LMDKIILPLVEGFAPAFVVLDYIRRQRDADQAILDKALKEQAGEIFKDFMSKSEANHFGEYVTKSQIEALRASYLGGTK
jgi:hypothetical protein